MSNTHHCHALGCKAACPRAFLMCGPCWAKVPRDLQREVYRTVKLRDMRAVDASWAPWWRAQARAIHAVALKTLPGEAKARSRKYVVDQMRENVSAKLDDSQQSLFGQLADVFGESVESAHLARLEKWLAHELAIADKVEGNGTAP